MAGIALVDSLFIPMTRDVDPGRSAEGISFLVLSFGAAARRIDPPASVVIAAACLIALTASLNHMLLKSPSSIWTPAGFLLLAFLMLGGQTAGSQEAKSTRHLRKTVGDVALLVPSVANFYLRG
jgi:hypothetical protein